MERPSGSPVMSTSWSSSVQAYRIVATADPDGWFREIEEANNTTEATVELTTSAEGLPLVSVVEG